MGFLKFLLLSGLAVVFSLQLRSEYSGIFWPELFLALLGLSSFFTKQPIFLLGLALPVLPFFEYGTLSCFVLAFNFGLFFKKKNGANPQSLKMGSDPIFSLLLILPLFVSLIFSLLHEVDYYLLKTIIINAGPYGLLEYTQQNYPVWYRALFHVATYVNFLILIFVIPKDTLVQRPFVKGLSSGVIFSCLIGLAQLLELHPWFSVNREIFWLHVGRYEGTFTDPNALGVMSALLIPYFYYLRKESVLVPIAGVMLACFSIFSESRTFWLAMLTWFVIANISKPKRLALIFAPMLIFIPVLNQFLQSLPFLNRFDRLFQTLNLNTFIDSLYSRLLMGEIAIRMWKTSPILGVGLERFYVNQEAVAKAAGLDLGDWRDNANNFYLQIASEQGVYGLIALFVLIVYLYLFSRKGSSRAANVLICILPIIFITGPHLFFEEVKYFVAIIIAANLSGNASVNNQTKSLGTNGTVSIFIYFLIGLFMIYIYKPAPKSLIGFWPKEASEDGEVAWTAVHAKMRLCDVPEKSVLEFRTYQVPSTLILQQDHKREEILIENTEWQSAELQASDLLQLKLTPTKLWSPGAGKVSGDKRWLGIMVKIPPNLCN